MVSKVLLETINVSKRYILNNHDDLELNMLFKEMSVIIGVPIDSLTKDESYISYEETQEILATVNEKEQIRKMKGVYYTPLDVVEFIIDNSLSLNYENLTNTNNKAKPHTKKILEKSVFDPTCGAGEFLMMALKRKFEILDGLSEEVSQEDIQKTVRTIHGNDLNVESIIISKLRIFLLVLNKYGAGKVKGVADILNNTFKNYDYVSAPVKDNNLFDVIVGNPPYVESSKSGLVLDKKYGNIYANVLDNAVHQLASNGVLGMIIPISFVATPRMKTIRAVLSDVVGEQFILNYADRPDSLFSSVHQKLSILFTSKTETSKNIYTGNYTYWYKTERSNLFNDVKLIKNDFVEETFIPKLGREIDSSIYRKIHNQSTRLSDLLQNGNTPIYLNMRTAFWTKAFLTEHSSSEYKVFRVESETMAKYTVCLLNSSLFWWFWNAVSDGWHITKKELTSFKVPLNVDVNKIQMLASNLENKLEETKVYVGTKQTEYQYKHKLCLNEIHEIDSYINELFGLSNEESEYIQQYELKYRTSGGGKNESN